MIEVSHQEAQLLILKLSLKLSLKRAMEAGVGSDAILVHHIARALHRVEDLLTSKKANSTPGPVEHLG